MTQTIADHVLGERNQQAGEFEIAARGTYAEMYSLRTRKMGQPIEDAIRDRNQLRHEYCVAREDETRHWKLRA